MICSLSTLCNMALSERIVLLHTQPFKSKVTANIVEQSRRGTVDKVFHAIMS